MTAGVAVSVPFTMHGEGVPGTAALLKVTELVALSQAPVMGPTQEPRIEDAPTVADTWVGLSGESVQVPDGRTMVPHNGEPGAPRLRLVTVA